MYLPVLNVLPLCFYCGIADLCMCILVILIYSVPLCHINNSYPYITHHYHTNLMLSSVKTNPISSSHIHNCYLHARIPHTHSLTLAQSHNTNIQCTPSSIHDIIQIIIFETIQNYKYLQISELLDITSFLSITIHNG